MNARRTLAPKFKIAERVRSQNSSTTRDQSTQCRKHAIARITDLPPHRAHACFSCKLHTFQFIGLAHGIVLLELHAQTRCALLATAAYVYGSLSGTLLGNDVVASLWSARRYAWSSFGFIFSRKISQHTRHTMLLSQLLAYGHGHTATHTHQSPLLARRP